MSAPESRYGTDAGTAGASASAPGAATGVRSYGAGQGEGASVRLPQQPGHADGCYGAVGGAYGAGAYGSAGYEAAGYGAYDAAGAPYGQSVPGAGPQASVPYGQVPYGTMQQGFPVAYAAGMGGAVAYQMPATSQPVQPPRKSRKGVVIAVLVALVAVVCAVLLALSMCSEEKSRRQGDAGQLEGKSDAEIQAELDRVVEEGMFNISIASVVEFASGSAEGDLRIENVPGNRYLMRVSIVRNDTGQQIYTTDMIEPNHHIQRDALDVDLPQGSYECTALFEALDPDTEELVGQAAAVITLNVLS